MSRQKRSTIAHFLNSTPDESAETWELLGDGITSLVMNYNPNTVEEQYVHQDTASKHVDSYAPDIPVEQAVWPGDDLYDFIDSLRQGGPVTGAAAETEIVEVRKYETPDTAGTSYPATKWPVSIQIDTFGGDGGGPGMISFTINITGDAVDGDFNVSTLAFTPTPA
jgi:hypothetical protein